jgi:hypothetical protein
MRERIIPSKIRQKVRLWQFDQHAYLNYIRFYRRRLELGLKNGIVFPHFVWRRQTYGRP